MPFTKDRFGVPIADLVTFNISLDQFEDVKRDIKFGALVNFGSAEGTLWTGNNGLYDWIPDGDAAIPMFVASTSSNDTLTGSGAQKLRVTSQGVDRLEITQDIELNGLTPVPVPIPIFRTYRQEVTQTGDGTGATVSANGKNDGEIWTGYGTFVVGVPPTKMGHIRPGKNQSEMGIYSVPANKTLIVPDWIPTATAGKSVEMGLYVSAVVEGVRRPFQLRATLYMYESAVPIPFKAPAIFRAGSDIDVRVVSSAVGTSAGVVFSQILVDNQFFTRQER